MRSLIAAIVSKDFNPQRWMSLSWAKIWTSFEEEIGIIILNKNEREFSYQIVSEKLYTFLLDSTKILVSSGNPVNK